MYIFIVVFLFLLLCFILNFRRRASIIKKVRCMTLTEKCGLLNEVAVPFGYRYDPCQDVFHTTLDAWQRGFGYQHSYDCLAPYLNMVFDCEPVYFDCDGKTWLLELWKGQYGIASGAEIGIYCADKIVSRSEQNRTLFHAAPDFELPVFSLTLRRTDGADSGEIADFSMPHWWLAAFSVGMFSKPEQLCADVCINFPNFRMTYAFADELIRLGYSADELQVCNSTVCFSFDVPRTPAPCGLITRAVRRISQWENRLFCRLYRFITRPFFCTADRLYYLYLYLPFVFKNCLRLHRRKGRRKCCRRRRSRR